MGKVKVHSVDIKDKRKIVGNLFAFFASLADRKEVFNFLAGFLTLSEILMLGRRLQIAELLLEEKTYEEIRRKMKVSYLTISSVERWLNSDEGKRLLVSEKISKIEKEIDKSGKNKFREYGYGLLDKYLRHSII